MAAYIWQSDGGQSLLPSQQLWCKLLEPSSATTRVVLDMFTVITPQCPRNTITFSSATFGQADFFLHIGFSTLFWFFFFPKTVFTFPPLTKYCPVITKLEKWSQHHETNPKKKLFLWFLKYEMVRPLFTNKWIWWGSHQRESGNLWAMPHLKRFQEMIKITPRWSCFLCMWDCLFVLHRLFVSWH